MKYYLMNVKRFDGKIESWYGHEIIYMNKKHMIYNYVENCSYAFGGDLNAEYSKWMEVSADELLEAIDNIIDYRSSDYFIKLSLVNGAEIEELNKDLKNFKQFRAKVFKSIKEN